MGDISKGVAYTLYPAKKYTKKYSLCSHQQTMLISLRSKNRISNQRESHKNRFACSKAKTKTWCFLLNVRICVASSFENKNEQNASDKTKKISYLGNFIAMQFSPFLIFCQLLSVYANSIQLSYIFNLFVYGTFILKTYFLPQNDFPR
jgi:hypothetical protein